MKRSWTALAVAAAAVLGVAGCNSYGNTFQNNTGATIISLSPAVQSAGSADFMLTVSGGTFVAQTLVQWNGKNLKTVVPTDSAGNVLGNVVTATVPAALVATPGVATVNTISPASGAGNNGLSNTISFVINPPANPTPALTAMSPMTAVAGGATFPLTLTGSTANGSSFLPTTDPTGGSIVRWSEGGVLYSSAPQAVPNPPGVCADPAYITTTSISATQIVVNVSQCLIKAQGTATVTVFNGPSPAPPGCVVNCNGGGGGGTSNAITFTICPTTQPSCPPAAAAKSGSTAAEMAAEESPSVSIDGRYVAYTAIQNKSAQIFVRDTCEGAATGCQAHTTMLSVAADGSEANDESHTPSMSSDGRYVAFSSVATNLVENAPAGKQIYLRDTCAGGGSSCQPLTILVSTDASGALVGTDNILPSVSSTGRYVAFVAVKPSPASSQGAAQAKTTVSTSNSGYRQVFIRDTCLGTTNCTAKTTRISLQPGDGTESGAKPAGPALSGDANHVGISGGNAATLFTRSVAVDDRVFLAITNGQR
jgi:hypothetical protein